MWMIIMAILLSVVGCFTVLWFDNSNDLILPISISAILAGIFQLLVQLWAFPTIGFFYAATWINLVFVVAIGSGVGFLFSSSLTSFVLPSSIFLLLIVIYIPTSCECFHSRRYRSLIGEVLEKDFSKDIPMADMNKIRLVPKSTAYTLAQKVLGQSEDGKILGSQLHIDFQNAAIQEVADELWWIFPLDFSGFFKWRNRRYIPGYIRVNAHDPTREAELVDRDTVEGKQYKIRYTPGAYWGAYLDRKIYNKFQTFYRDECSFEVDDNWRPYYVISILYPEIGFSGYKVKGVIIMDPQTGDMKFRSGDKIPKWIDRVKPLSLAHQHITWWGEYIHGWLNSAFAAKDVQMPTDYSYGRDLWFIKQKDKNYWFTGMTSVSASDQSLVGAMMVNTRTGEASYFSIHGTDENGVLETVDASLGAESARWTPTQPIPYNIYGVPTWVLPVISNEGIYQRIALVDMGNINTIAVDRTLDKTLEKYRTMLASNSSKNIFKGNSLFGSLGPVTVSRVGSTVVDGNKTFYLMVKGYENVLFSSSGESNKTRLISLARPGDNVRIKFVKSKGQVINIEKFDIVGIQLRN